MSTDSGGITLKIDADTAAYIAKIVQMSEAHKKMHESAHAGGEQMARIGDFAKEALGALTGFALPLTAAAGAMGALEYATEAWKRNLESAREETEKITRLHEVLVRTGMPAGAESAMRTAAGSALSTEQLTGVAAAIGAPGNPTPTIPQITDITKSAARAAQAQEDPAIFAGIDTRLIGSGIPNPESHTQYIMRHIAQENQEHAIDAMLLAPDQADDISRLYANPKLRNREMMRTLRSAMGAWQTAGRPGKLIDFLGTGLAARAVGREGMGYLSQIKGNLGPAIDDHELDKAIATMHKDPEVSQKNLIEEMGNETTKTVNEMLGSQGQEMELLDAKMQYVTADGPFGPEKSSFANAAIGGHVIPLVPTPSALWFAIKALFGGEKERAEAAWMRSGSKAPFPEFYEKWKNRPHPQQPPQRDHSLDDFQSHRVGGYEHLVAHMIMTHTHLGTSGPRQAPQMGPHIPSTDNDRMESQRMMSRLLDMLSHRTINMNSQGEDAR